MRMADTVSTAIRVMERVRGKAVVVEKERVVAVKAKEAVTARISTMQPAGTGIRIIITTTIRGAMGGTTKSREDRIFMCASETVC